MGSNFPPQPCALEFFLINSKWGGGEHKGWVQGSILTSLKIKMESGSITDDEVILNICVSKQGSQIQE